MVGFGAVAAVSWARELTSYLAWRKSLPAKVRAEQLLHWLDARQSAQGARLVLGDIAKEHRLAADPDAYAVMADLELAADRAVRLVFTPPPSSLWQSETFMRWYEAAPAAQRNDKLRTFGHAFLDDVSRLVQELEPTARQAQALPPALELPRSEPPQLPPAAESAG